MKKRFFPLAAVLTFSAVWLNTTSDTHASQALASPKTEISQPAANRSTVATGGIPDRPEKLKFPPLTYEAPAPQQFRVALKSGPVAYVVPDRELPL
ncbi:MAG: hypothetical protein ACTHKU_00645, partial [Verrucomicrobiota bacterium]